MQTSALLSIVMPVALGIIMLGLGLSLKIDDFKRVVEYPKAVLVGLCCQMFLLPLVCFLVAVGFKLSPELAVGLMLLSASPGGAVANLYSHLSKGDVALNVTLTALNSVLTLFVLPLIVNISISYFMQSGQVVPLQFAEVSRVFAIVLVPVAVGMFIKYYWPTISEKLNNPVKIMSAIFLALVIIAVVVKEKENMASYFQQVGIPALVFNVLSMTVGFFIPIILNLGKKQSISISMEIGLHNGTLAIFIATNVLKDITMGIPAAIYSLIMFFTAAAFGLLVNIKKD